MKAKQKQQSIAAYHGMTESGKSRYVSKLVEIEVAQEPRGAQPRVADMLDISEGRVSQLLNADKNRKAEAGRRSAEWKLKRVMKYAF